MTTGPAVETNQKQTLRSSEKGKDWDIRRVRKKDGAGENAQPTRDRLDQHPKGKASSRRGSQSERSSETRHRAVY